MEFAVVFIAVAGVFVSLRLYAEIRSLRQYLWNLDDSIYTLRQEQNELKRAEVDPHPEFKISQILVMVDWDHGESEMRSLCKLRGLSKRNKFGVVTRPVRIRTAFDVSQYDISHAKKREIERLMLLNNVQYDPELKMG